MSSNARKAEKRRENEAAYIAEHEARMIAEHDFREKFGPLLVKLDELGIDADLLADFVAAKIKQ